MAWLSAIKALFAKPRFIARAAHEMSSAEKALIGKELRDHLGYWPCACLTEHGPDATCKNCNGFGAVAPRDWCAACSHRDGDGCDEQKKGILPGLRERGGAWVAGNGHLARVHRCPRYDGPETAPITGQEDTGG